MRLDWRLRPIRRAGLMLGKGAMPEQDEIEALIGAVARRDRRAFESLYAATSAKLYGVALRVLQQPGRGRRRAAGDVPAHLEQCRPLRADGAEPDDMAHHHRAEPRHRPDQGAAGRPTGRGGGGGAARPRARPEAAAIAAGEAARIVACLAELPADRAAAISGAYLTAPPTRSWRRASACRSTPCGPGSGGACPAEGVPRPMTEETRHSRRRRPAGRGIRAGPARRRRARRFEARLDRRRRAQGARRLLAG